MIHDCFRLLHPRAREFTFHRGDHMAQSRLDRVYIPPHLVTSLVSARHKPGISDHCQVEVKIKLGAGQGRPNQQKKKLFWKLNTSLLDNPDFKEQFQTLYEKLVRFIGEYADHSEWWEILAKPAIARFCKDFSSKLSQERRCTKRFLYASLRIFLRQENWAEVARIKESIRRMLVYDMTGVKIRSRQSQYAEEERGSLYHYNKERKNNNLTQMRYVNEDGIEVVTDDVSKIEELSVSFYDALFNGRHDKDLNDTGVAFLPSDEYLEEFLDKLSPLSEEAKTKVVRTVTYEELEEIVKSCPNGKSPGLDGLPYELYKATFDVIGKEFLEVIKDQLRNFALIESGKHGATVTPSKVEGVPLVTELRPLTLLCCDYRILSKTINNRLNPVMGEVVENSQLATGEKDKNILTGAYDIISTIDYVNKNRKHAFIASYDMVKAYDRASVRFLLLVMERMGFPEIFRGWVEMLHHEATTRLVLPSGLSRVIKVLFSFRQGDPVALNLYLLQMEPFLRMIRATLSGLQMTNFKQLDKAYCDDVQIMSNDTNDLIKFDNVMQKFEKTSGAILSRTKKSKLMGIGTWKGKVNCPNEVKWMKVVDEMKIFGFIVCPTYQKTLEKTWETVVRGFVKVLFSWQSRQLETLSQRVEAAKVFALSKLYYVAQVLPLPTKHRKNVEKSLSKFIFQGRHERLKLSEIENTIEQGGLGLPNIAVKADSLLTKQMCRMISLPGNTSFRLVGYWMGGALSDTGWGEDFPQLADIGPVSHALSRDFPLHRYMVDTFVEAVGRGEVRNSNLKGVTTREIYKSRMSSSSTPPKVEIKYPLVNFPNIVYPRVVPAVLEMKVRDVIFSIVHGIYKNRERLLQQGRVDNQLCPNQACKNETLIQSVEHIFCKCYKVRAAWQWTRQKLTELWTDHGPAVVATNMEILMQMYPPCRKEVVVSFLLGTFLEQVHSEVMLKGKDLLVDTLKGVLRFRLTQTRSRAVPFVFLPQNWL